MRMKSDMEHAAKRLTRVRLVNWHYFENETIALNGSALISGENTAGKSTILDAIQLVLTTNSKKFNVAANEKGNRNLKGYVRCKIGNVGEAYLRKGTVPANVALEFFEEKYGRYFVIGVHLLSADEESPVIKKWYAEECRLEDLSFITDNRPSLNNEFRNKTKKISYMDTDKAARDKFRHRLGNLDEKFFDIIPKSLAFKPMDNVKEFINKFVLDERKVDVQGLRKNIETLDELEKTLGKTKAQLEELDAILTKFDEIEKKDKDIMVNDILLRVAAKDAVKETVDELAKDINLKEQTILGLKDRLIRYEEEIKTLEDKKTNIMVSIQENESSRLVEALKRSVDEVQKNISRAKDDKAKLKNQMDKLAKYIKKVSVLGRRIDRQANLGLLLENAEEKEKLELVSVLKEHFEKDYSEIIEEFTLLKIRLKEADDKRKEYRETEEKLNKRILSYPEYTVDLKKSIEKEFQNRGINSKVYILSDLLDITDEKWRDAVEGYMNTQKFYLVVEPEYFPVALEVYNKNRSRIHTAGLINTRKVPLEYETDNKSLSYVVKSDNEYAKAYVEYLLGRVKRCDKVEELEQYSIAITPECMLYQGYVVRHLDPKTYRNPYIGANAYRVQLENVRRSIEEVTEIIRKLKDEQGIYLEVTEAGKNVNVDMIALYKNSPDKLASYENEFTGLKAELKAAEKDPALIELQIKLNDTEKELEAKKSDRNRENNEMQRLFVQVAGAREALGQKQVELKEKERWTEQAMDDHGAEYSVAIEKYKLNRKSKSPQRIYDNFSPQRSQFENERNELLNGDRGLRALQNAFNSRFSMDFTVGLTQEAEYREAADKLRKVEIVRYEDKLRTAKKDCEKIFRGDFLSKMKEYIENAKQEFRNLNKALDNIYYGDDSYHFNITFDKRKESLYRMITSDYNMEGETNLWTGMFEAEYRDEIEDLFAKLMVSSDEGERVIDEYTDYRSYLDYDIEIRKKNGQKQRFSDIYAEKSGSETQVPYYVAIAASFYQLYRFGNSIRIMLLDEAFDKMDDDRIQSMMDFMNGLGLQVILATPPAKIEVIGEHVDTILTAIRVGNGSIVEEYEL